MQALKIFVSTGTIKNLTHFKTFGGISSIPTDLPSSRSSIYIFINNHTKDAKQNSVLDCELMLGKKFTQQKKIMIREKKNLNRKQFKQGDDNF